MQELTPMFDELVAFLTQEYLLDREELKVFKGSPEQAKLLQVKLATLSEERKIQLLEYEWSLLPVERIRINLVTDSGFKEFNAEL
jgi:hypothetical protein